MQRVRRALASLAALAGSGCRPILPTGDYTDPPGVAWYLFRVGALPSASTATAPRTVGRYLLFDEIAAGGMATVHLARLVGPIGFARTVAIKQIHAHLASDARVRSMFIDEARMAARVQHPNVVTILDVVASERELSLVMDYVHGESLSHLVPLSSEGGRPVSVAIASAILIGVLHGLHAAHQANDEKGQPLSLVHRDVSPQNILVGLDGVPRVVDFGIAKAAGRLQTTADGQLKGKAGYLAPEQILDEVVDRRADVYAASVVLWELLAGRRLFDGGGTASTFRQVLSPAYEAPSHYAPSVPAELDRLVMQGLAFKPDERFASGWDMAIALEKAVPPATVRQISEWVEAIAGERLRRLAQRVADIERASPSEVPPPRRRGESQDQIPTMHESASPPPPSDVSSLSLATPARATVARRAHAKRLAMAALALVFLGGLAMFGTSRSHPGREDPRSHAAGMVNAPSPESLSTGVLAASTTTAAVVVAPPSAVASSPDPRPSPPTSAKPRGTRRSPPHPIGANCAVPFTWSPDGTKIPKAECL